MGGKRGREIKITYYSSKLTLFGCYSGNKTRERERLGVRGRG